MREEYHKTKQFIKSLEHIAEPTSFEKNDVAMKMKLDLALHNDLTVVINYYDNPHYNTVKGKLLGIDPLAGIIIMENGKEIDTDSMLNVYID